MPVSAAYTPDPRHPRLGEAFFDAVAPANFPKTILRHRDDRAAAQIGLEGLTEAEWIAHFARFTPLPDNLPTPLALRYHGHQFRSYNPEIGDGRGFLFAQLRERGTGRLLDLGTKGSGQTPWSRFGDGRLTLKGGVREVLATTLLEALGVNTSKSLSLIETGEALERNDEPSPTRSAVLVRLSHSHVRIGTFQRLLALELEAEMKRLIDYAIETYYPAAAEAADPVLSLYQHTSQAVAEMGAQWFAAGFVHGVLNTDNIVITGESFDYGPWRFLPHYEPGFTAAYFDHSGLYAFGRQPQALHWNLARFGECLAAHTSMADLEKELDAFPSLFQKALVAQTHRRLGLKPETDEAALARVQAFYDALLDTKLPFERAFFDLIGGARDGRVKASDHAEAYRAEPWTKAIGLLKEGTPAEIDFTHPYLKGLEPVTLLIEEVEALWDHIDQHNDWAPLEAKLKMFEFLRGFYEPLLQA